MFNTLALNRQTLKTKTIITACSIAACVVLPQLFHMLGAVSGLGTALGATFLPMHLPVLLAGLLSGSAAGAVCGLLSPAVSFALSGMPAANMVPLMMLELAAYGCTAGLLSKRNMPTVLKVLLAQIAGRAVRALAVLGAIYLLGNQAFQVSQTWNIVLTGLPGIILQLCILPLLMYRLENTHA